MYDLRNPEILAAARRVPVTLVNRVKFLRLRKHHSENADRLEAMSDAAKWNHSTWVLEWSKSRDIVLAIDTVLQEKEWPTARIRSGGNSAHWIVSSEVGGGFVTGMFMDFGVCGPSGPSRMISIRINIGYPSRLDGIQKCDGLSTDRAQQVASDLAVRSPMVRPLRHEAARMVKDQASRFLNLCGIEDYNPVVMAKWLYSTAVNETGAPLGKTTDGLWDTTRTVETNRSLPFLQVWSFTRKIAECKI